MHESSNFDSVGLGIVSQLSDMDIECKSTVKNVRREEIAKDAKER